MIRVKVSSDVEYICDDRDVIEEIRAIKNMSDEEFEKHINELEQKPKNTD